MPPKKVPTKTKGATKATKAKGATKKRTVKKSTIVTFDMPDTIQQKLTRQMTPYPNYSLPGPNYSFSSPGYLNQPRVQNNVTTTKYSGIKLTPSELSKFQLNNPGLYGNVVNSYQITGRHNKRPGKSQYGYDGPNLGQLDLSNVTTISQKPFRPKEISRPVILPPPPKEISQQAIKALEKQDTSTLPEISQPVILPPPPMEISQPVILPPPPMEISQQAIKALEKQDTSTLPEMPLTEKQLNDIIKDVNSAVQVLGILKDNISAGTVSEKEAVKVIEKQSGIIQKIDESVNSQSRIDSKEIVNTVKSADKNTTDMVVLDEIDTIQKVGDKVIEEIKEMFQYNPEQYLYDDVIDNKLNTQGLILDMLIKRVIRESPENLLETEKKLMDKKKVTAYDISKLAVWKAYRDAIPKIEIYRNTSFLDVKPFASDIRTVEFSFTYHPDYRFAASYTVDSRGRYQNYFTIVELKQLSPERRCVYIDKVSDEQNRCKWPDK